MERNLTLLKTEVVSVTKTNRLMLLGETISVYCEKHMKYTNTARAECRV
jgi:hypothetical protein